MAITTKTYRLTVKQQRTKKVNKTTGIFPSDITLYYFFKNNVLGLETDFHEFQYRSLENKVKNANNFAISHK
jgi:hypothetical protein